MVPAVYGFGFRDFGMRVSGLGKASYTIAGRARGMVLYVAKYSPRPSLSNATPETQNAHPQTLKGYPKVQIRLNLKSSTLPLIPKPLNPLGFRVYPVYVLPYRELPKKFRVDP